MLIKYNANAYLCGHDHDMQHIHEDNSTVEYFLSGAGHETEDSDDNKVWWCYCEIYSGLCLQYEQLFKSSIFYYIWLSQEFIYIDTKY